jgi:hypothetical protein
VRRGQRNRWTHDHAPHGEGIAVIHREGVRKEIHDLDELALENKAKALGTTTKSIRELIAAGIITL